MVSVVGDLAVCRDVVFVIKTKQNKTKQLVLQVQIIAFLLLFFPADREQNVASPTSTSSVHYTVQQRKQTLKQRIANSMAGKQQYGGCIGLFQ